MFITTIVPSYRRPHDLSRCLAALANQTRRVDEIVVIVRDTDTDTQTFLTTVSDLPLRIAIVTEPGVIAAMNLGLTIATGDILTFTDDDATPHPDWLQRIEAHYQSDRAIVGVGGRDWVYHGTELEDGHQAIVGKLQWFGRLIGNHHIGIGSAREVDVLKGVNMSFRRSAIAGLRFDDRLKGNGAQVHFEVAFSLAVKARGGKLIYDPGVAVDHFPAHRFDEDQRSQFNPIAWFNRAYNETFALLTHFSPTQRRTYALWSTLFGHRESWGMAQLLRFLPKEKYLAIEKWQLSYNARSIAFQDWKRSINAEPFENASTPISQRSL